MLLNSGLIVNIFFLSVSSSPAVAEDCRLARLNSTSMNASPAVGYQQK